MALNWAHYLSLPVRMSRNANVVSYLCLTPRPDDPRILFKMLSSSRTPIDSPVLSETMSECGLRLLLALHK